MLRAVAVCCTTWLLRVLFRVSQNAHCMWFVFNSRNNMAVQHVNSVASRAKLELSIVHLTCLGPLLLALSIASATFGNWSWGIKEVAAMVEQRGIDKRVTIVFSILP